MLSTYSKYNIDFSWNRFNHIMLYYFRLMKLKLLSSHRYLKWQSSIVLLLVLNTGVCGIYAYETWELSKREIVDIIIAIGIIIKQTYQSAQLTSGMAYYVQTNLLNENFIDACFYFDIQHRRRLFNLKFSTKLREEWAIPAHGKMYSIQHYVIKFVSDLRQVGGFLWVLRFPPPIKLTATI